MLTLFDTVVKNRKEQSDTAEDKITKRKLGLSGVG
jgi:hypothetical protein